MIFFNKIRDFIYGLEERQFYYYSGIFLGIVIILSAGMIYYQYDSTTELIDAIDEINEERINKVRPLLDKAARVKRKLKEINAMLAQEPDFKIGGYFKDLKLPMQYSIATPTQTDRDDNYIESALKASFNSITMKQLLELLQILEKTERIYIKELDIKKSVKPENSIDVELTIATLLPKIVETD
jgi:hypothetical protein